MPIIDIHPHVISTDNVRYPLQPLGGNQSTWSRDRPTPYDKMIEEMDNAGVAKSAIVQASTAYGHDNSYVAEAIAAHPKRFTGVFSVDMLAADNVEKMKYWLARGFSGMRLFTTGSTMPGQATWFDDPRTFPAWQHASDTGTPVCMQMTPQGFPQLRGLIAVCAKKTQDLLEQSAGFSAAIRDRRLGVEVAIIQRLAESLAARLRRRDPLADRVHHGKAEALLLALGAALPRMVK